MTPEGLQQEILWQEFFSEPTLWRDNRRSKKTPRHPDFKHTKSRDALWLSNRYKPAWVDSQLATRDAGTRRPPSPVPNSVPRRPSKLSAQEGGFKVGTCTQVVEALNFLVQQGFHIPKVLFYRVLKRCTAQKDLVLGRRVHALTVQSGYEEDAFLATHLIDLYAAHGRLEDAMRVFSKVAAPDAYNWASIISAHARHGEPTQAIKLYHRMGESTLEPCNRTFVAVLKACASSGDLAAGKEVHAHILASPGKADLFVQTCLVDMYAKCSSVVDARRVFDGLLQKDVVTWTVMLGCYAQQGMGQEALSLYTIMQQEGITPPDSVTFVCLLQACASIGEIAQLHSQIEERGLQHDVVVGGSLVNMYAKCGSLEDARRVFDRLAYRDVVTWNAMIAGYSQRGLVQEALGLFSVLQQQGSVAPDSVTFVCLLQACASAGVDALHQGKLLHAQVEERGLEDNVVIGASLVNMYAKCGSLEDARSIFDRLPHKNVVTWTAMITAYSQQGMGQEAFSLYSAMQQEGITLPDCATFVCLLQACAGQGRVALYQGLQLHAQIEERGLQVDVVVGGSLVNMYAKCGSLEDASRVFDRLPRRTVETWTAMIAGFAQEGMVQEALTLYSRMQQEGIVAPDSVTYVCLLQACATAAALPLGKQLHSRIEEEGLHADLAVGSSLVNMYAKCGSMVDAEKVFDSLPGRDIAAWNALIAGYTRQGDSKTVFGLVGRMTQEGTHPEGIVFLSVLTVCSHAGLVDKGRQYFDAMSRDYGITPGIEHYTCMMDLLGRAGHLDEALQMVKTMPFQPDAAVWHTLLAACQKWNSIEVGRPAFEFAVSLDAKDEGAYVLMSNIYAGAQMWEEAKEIQAMRLNSGACKQPGQSWWTDLGGVAHVFGVGSRMHTEEVVEVSR